MTFAKEDILVCMALKEEGGVHLENVGANVVYTGLGKVNAAYHLTRAFSKYKPKLVLNFGTAGSKLFKRGEFVAAHRFLQRDMDVSPLGFKPYETPFEDLPMVLEFEKHFNELPHGTVGTGDSFETDHQHDRGELVDMEAYALAKVCYLENLSFACVKYISDGADENATEHWQDSLNEIPERFVEFYLSLLKR